MMNTRYAVFDPVEERFEWFASREQAEACARDLGIPMGGARE